jgi:hypothetical protein
MIAKSTMYAVTVDKKIVYKGSKTDMRRLAKRFSKPNYIYAGSLIEVYNTPSKKVGDTVA